MCFLEHDFPPICKETILPNSDESLEHHSADVNFHYHQQKHSDHLEFTQGLRCLRHADGETILFWLDGNCLEKFLAVSEFWSTEMKYSTIKTILWNMFWWRLLWLHTVHAANSQLHQRSSPYTSLTKNWGVSVQEISTHRYHFPMQFDFLTDRH